MTGAEYLHFTVSLWLLSKFLFLYIQTSIFVDQTNWPKTRSNDWKICLSCPKKDLIRWTIFFSLGIRTETHSLESTRDPWAWANVSFSSTEQIFQPVCSANRRKIARSLYANEHFVDSPESLSVRGSARGRLTRITTKTISPRKHLTNVTPMFARDLSSNSNRLQFARRKVHRIAPALGRSAAPSCLRKVITVVVCSRHNREWSASRSTWWLVKRAANVSDLGTISEAFSLSSYTCDTPPRYRE